MFGIKNFVSNQNFKVILKNSGRLDYIYSDIQQPIPTLLQLRQKNY